MSKIPLQVSPSSMSFQNGHGVIIELLLFCRREDMFHTCEKAQVCQHAKKKKEKKSSKKLQFFWIKSTVMCAFLISKVHFYI